jgi:hypothetical protein
MTRSISSMPAFSRSLLRERRASGQQLVQEHAQRVDVAPRVDVELIDLGLLGRHVLQRADDGSESGDERLLGQRLTGRLGHAEVDHLWHGFAIVESDEHVGGFEIAMNDPLLVRVLNGVADGDEEFEPLPRRQSAFIAILGNWHPLDEVHDEVRPARGGGSGIQHAGDVGVIHQRQGLAFGLEAGDDLPGVHTGFDQLHRDQTLDRFALLGEVDRAHAALADELDDLVGANHGAA